MMTTQSLSLIFVRSEDEIPECLNCNKSQILNKKISPVGKIWSQFPKPLKVIKDAGTAIFCPTSQTVCGVNHQH